ncbi:biotin--[acetyl-CoA-carboxylase] ligase [Desulfosporosinus nitroreducens]|uniref:biotin--[biotin carboxyl-carrier protein] ligase n=1 Tax=Desulfosporosinus nitroreducens TaxID=2018668 RepID=A0ABT8QQZ8_9FIRM|nr:biotin--[acetyl-CoA-carboxylase] ligase [Desulfosporosinus nitroreducens]MCO1599892.1 biotin--[acetyl-CoA-carboxylase] ligase [Desulfosporosinus nitroreducens]MDO0823065.1 biotin--[acetyl-CoA-carboxylase] ligase [Desulfosporosinus nitroreducens]
MEHRSIEEEACLPHKHISLLGKEIYLYPELTSTNSVARQMAVSGAAEGTIVMCRSQSAGRGRMQRQWHCPPGKGLLLSMILRPQISVQFVPQLTLLTAVVVAETIKIVTGCAAGIKWPNDIFINDKKVCGILAESSFSKSNFEYIIIGLGINVNLGIHHLPSDCQKTSTSLSLERGENVSRVKLLKQFIISWDEHIQGFVKAGHPYLRDKWIKNNVTLGENVIVNKGDSCLHGLAVDISENGGLIVRLADGSLQEFLAEDVSIRKRF